MENDEGRVVERLEAAAALLEKARAALEEHRGSISGEIERISAMVEGVVATQRETGLAEKLAVVEQELAVLKAAAVQNAVQPLRRTMPAATAEMLAKHGIGEGPVDIRALDKALTGLSLEQRIAVKSQLLRAGAIS